MLRTGIVHDVVPATSRTVLVRVVPDRPLPFAAGQAVALGAQGQPERRLYSIALSPQQAKAVGQLEFLVGLGPDGSAGPHLSSLAPGLQLDIEGPFGTFTFPPAPVTSPILFVAGGSGIAPLRAMIHEALALDPPARLSLLYSARTPDDFAFGDELTALSRAGHVRLLRTATRAAGPAWHEARGRISRAELEAVVDDPETLCFICGPEALVHEVPRMLREVGVDPARIRIEEWASRARRG